MVLLATCKDLEEARVQQSLRDAGCSLSPDDIGLFLEYVAMRKETLPPQAAREVLFSSWGGRVQCGGIHGDARDGGGR